MYTLYIYVVYGAKMECENCHKKLSNYYSLWLHHKICKDKNNGHENSLKRQKIDEPISIPEYLDWKKEDEIDSDNVVTSDDERTSDEDLKSARKDDPERKKDAIDVTSEEDSLKNLVAFEKNELLEILKEFVNVVDEEDKYKLIGLERLLNNFFISEYETPGFLEPLEETFPKVHAQLDNLTYTKIPRYELTRAKILVNNLDKKRRILQDFFRGFKNNRDVCETAKRLVQERMISSEVFDKLRKLEKPNFENISAILQGDYKHV